MYKCYLTIFLSTNFLSTKSHSDDIVVIYADLISWKHAQLYTYTEAAGVLS